LFKNIGYEALESLMKSNRSIALIDVRNENEEPEIYLDVTHRIPLPELSDRISELDNFKELIFLCKSGKRSSLACQIAKQKYPDKILYNLKDGILSLQTI